MFAAYYSLSWEEAIREFYFGNGDLVLLSSETTAKKAHVIVTSDHETTAQLKD